MNSAFTRGRVGWAARPGYSPGQPFQPGAITGGLNGTTIEARTPAELRSAIAHPGPVWIIAHPEAGGRQRERLVIARDNLTLIGLPGFLLTGHGIRIDRAMNVAICGVTVAGASGDAFEVSESRVVLLSACEAKGFTDGGIDIVRGSTDVSIVDCTVSGGEKGCLIGADDRPHVRQFTGSLAHLGAIDDRHTRVWLEGCTFIGAKVRTPLVRHGCATLIDHSIIGGGKGPLVESRTGARVLWVSGQVQRTGGRPELAASFRSQDTVTVGRLYVAPGVHLGGSTVQTNWSPTAAQLADMGVMG